MPLNMYQIINKIYSDKMFKIVKQELEGAVDEDINSEVQKRWMNSMENPENLNVFHLNKLKSVLNVGIALEKKLKCELTMLNCITQEYTEKMKIIKKINIYNQIIFSNNDRDKHQSLEISLAYEQQKYDDVEKSYEEIIEILEEDNNMASKIHQEEKKKYDININAYKEKIESLKMLEEFINIRN